MKEKHLQMYMRISEAVALTSSATRLKVGAVAVKNNMVIGTGYNALACGVHGACEDLVRSYRDDYQTETLVTREEVRHAEKNLLLNLTKSTESSEGAIIFCTHACCYQCSLDIVDAGITKFIYKNDYRDDYGLTYLRDNDLTVEKL